MRITPILKSLPGMRTTQTLTTRLKPIFKKGVQSLREWFAYKYLINLKFLFALFLIALSQSFLERS
jgi:hypothetical protein